MIIKSLAEEPLPVYGDGENIRDWLYVEDHARALRWSLSAAQWAKPITSAAATSGPISKLFGEFAKFSTNCDLPQRDRGRD